MISDTSTSARRRATGIGAIAIVLWATLALGAASTGAIPPFQMTAITFAVAGSAGGMIAAALGRDLRPAFRQSPAVWLLGLSGLFGYHFFYFLAFRLAPAAAVEVNLINYLWPLLIVLFAGIGVTGGLGRAQLLGALAGLAGCVLIVAGRASDTGNGAGSVTLSLDHWPGYAAALACAVLWSGYSVLSGRLCRHVPTEAVIGQCLGTALLALICHLTFETTAWPSAGQWLAAGLMGLGPMGAAFYVWDYGVKNGDVQTLGALCYAAPLLSTVILVATGAGQGGPQVWTAAALIVGGALLASRSMWRRG